MLGEFEYLLIASAVGAASWLLPASGIAATAIPKVQIQKVFIKARFKIRCFIQRSYGFDSFVAAGIHPLLSGKWSRKT